MRIVDEGFRNEWWGSHTSPYQCLAFSPRFFLSPLCTLVCHTVLNRSAYSRKTVILHNSQVALILFLVPHYFPVFFSCFVTAFFFYGSCSLLFGLAKARLKLSQRRSLSLLQTTTTTTTQPPTTTQTF